MENSNFNFKQSKDWEEACIKTRRNINSRQKRIKKFSIKKGDCVLDLGCGDGLNIKILNNLGVKKVVGVDISRDLLKLAKRNNPRAKFYLGTAEKLPFKAEVFDVVFVDSVFHHLLDYNKAVEELKRVIKKNGLLCFIEPHKSIWRRMLDLISVLPVSRFLPILKERREAYLGEIHLMKHWLSTENDFYNTLGKYKFKKIFLQSSLLSMTGEFRKNV